MVMVFSMKVSIISPHGWFLTANMMKTVHYWILSVLSRMYSILTEVMALEYMTIKSKKWLMEATLIFG